MKELEKLTLIPEGLKMTAGIDICGNFRQLFRHPTPSPGCIFLLCTQGNCTLTIHLTRYSMTANSIAVIYPEIYFQINEQSEDCRFFFVGFSKDLVRSAHLFSQTIKYTPYIIESPVLQLSGKVSEVLRDSIKVIIKSLRIDNFMDEMQINLAYSQLILHIGALYEGNAPEKKSPRYSRNQEIVKELVRLVILYYKTERNVSFYAEKMHLSPQHLSTTIKKITGKTLTDIISSFIIHDAQAKLRSTEMTIQEIAYSLNFTDISFFGKYFKRYTGMSPKRYRNS